MKPTGNFTALVSNVTYSYNLSVLYVYMFGVVEVWTSCTRGLEMGPHQQFSNMSMYNNNFSNLIN